MTPIRTSRTPPKRAASGLDPAARNSNPALVRASHIDSPTAMGTASKMPAWPPPGSSRGRSAADGIGTVIASPATGSVHGPVARYSARNSATKLSMTVTNSSLIPRVARSQAGIDANRPPPTTPASSTTGSSTIAGNPSSRKAPPVARMAPA